MPAPDPVAQVRRAVRAALDDAPAGRGSPRGDDDGGGAGALVVACSGGADSLALAAAVAGLAARRGCAAHGVVVDHGLQDGSAAVAARAAERLDVLGLAARVVAVDVTGGGGPEAAARRARYDALRRVSAECADAPVLLGHTLDDQAETELHGLARGAGARSLAGMRRWEPPWLRPLLGVRRATTRAACAAAGLPVWDDPHNADPRFTRARLRHEALPLLEDVLSGGVAQALARTAAQLADDDAALSALAAGRAAALTGDDGTLDARGLAAEPAAVRRRVLRAWLAAAGAGYDDAGLRAVDALLCDWRGQGAPPLPGGLEVVRRHGRLSLRPAVIGG